jgi:lysophospholipase L1-like esterase
VTLRSRLLLGLAIGALGLPGAPFAQQRSTDRWIGTWATAPAGVADTPQQFDNQTVRLIVRTSAGGERLRVRISNTFGAEPLMIGAAHIARRAANATIRPDTDRALTFGGRSSFAVPVGALVLSDPVSLAVPAGSDLAVSIYLPRRTVEMTTHFSAFQTNYVSSAGDFAAAETFQPSATITTWPFLTGVDVVVASQPAAIVAFGDSITDGASSTRDANRRWPDLLAARLRERPDLHHLGVLNQGIIGNRILHPTETQFGNLFGPAGLARFDRDVLAQAGVQYVIVLLGINDIGHPGANAPASDEVSPDDMIAGYRQFIERAHEKGVAVFGATLLPFEDTTIARFYSVEKEAKRQAVNRWIRTGGAFDAVIDFDQVIRDPARPTRMLLKYDSGDHLHPNDAGMAAMANAIPLDLFTGNRRSGSRQ